MAISYLSEKDLVYDPKKMFAVTNWSDEDITVNWHDDLGDNFYTLHTGETKSYPQYLAYFITGIFVDREMYKDAAKLPNNPDGSPTKQRERAEMAVVNKDLRKPYEDKTLQEIRAGEEDPAVTAMRAKIRQELIIEGNLSSELHLNSDGSEEFPDVPKIKNKGGRPKKTVPEVAPAL